MNRFKFRLESVLRVRGVEETRRKREFSVALQGVQNAEARMNETLQEMEDQDRIAAERETGALTVQELKIHNQYTRQLELKKANHAVLLTRAREVLDTRMNELLEATRRKKTIERLRERSYMEHVKEVNREEQADLDELTTQKYKNEQPRSE